MAGLGMTSRRPGFFAAAGHVAASELAEIVFSPGLYLFIPLIVLQTIGSSTLQVGYLDTPLLLTWGNFAVNTMSQLATCVCLLLLWYAVESIERERTHGLRRSATRRRSEPARFSWERPSRWLQWRVPSSWRRAWRG